MSATFRPSGGLQFQPKVTEVQHVYIDVGQKVRDHQVVRDGVAVGVYEIDPDRFDDFFAGRDQVVHKVVSQSIPAGTPVPEGTSVDLILAEPGRLPVGVIQDVHLDIAERPMSEVYGRIVEDRESEVRRIIGRTEERGVLAPEDEQRIEEIFAQADLEIVDEGGRDISSAYTTMQVLMDFGAR